MASLSPLSAFSRLSTVLAAAAGIRAAAGTTCLHSSLPQTLFAPPPQLLCSPPSSALSPSASRGISSSSRRQSTASTSAAADGMASKKSFMEAVKGRRTHYALTDRPSIGDAQIEQILADALLHVPSSFNAQSTRLVVLLKDEHKKFWDFTLEALEPHLKPETRASTDKKIAGFRAAYGTVLFFEDPDPVDELKRKFPSYADKFGTWSEQTSAMHQMVLWTAFDAEGMGCNLQHYNPLVDIKAKEEWSVPMTWSLTAQLVFGGRADPNDQPASKPKNDLSKSLFIHGK